MHRILRSLSVAVACLGAAACGDGDGAGQSNTGQPTGNEAAAKQTIAAGLDQNSRFFQAAKAAGLDATLSGPDPYTVFVPDDQAFAKLPAGTAEEWMKPESRGDLTRILTYHILPGTVLAADIGKHIDNSEGKKGLLITVGGSTLTATREGDRIVLTDAAGTKATVTATDQQHSNGVVHRVDSVLMPGEGQASSDGAAAGQ